MATISERLASSLTILKDLQEVDKIAVKSSDLSRTHRERLVRSGFLKEVMRGWYIPTRPDEPAGESTSWYTSFWYFCAAYLNERFGEEWSLSAEQSVILHAGNLTVPRQLLVRSPLARNQTTQLPHDTSIFETRARIAEKEELVIDPHGLRLFTLESAMIYCPEPFFRNNPVDARAVLGTFRDGTDLLRRLLDGGHSVVAGRLAGAFRNIGRDAIADDILAGMRSVGYAVSEQDPFASPSTLLIPSRQVLPHVNRLQLMWMSMRETVLEVFPSEPGFPRDSSAYLQRVSELFVNDAYNSLSIEGYRVSADLIERIKAESWQQELHEADRQHRDAMAARGYWQAFQSVKKALEEVLSGAESSQVAEKAQRTWYRELFAPSVEAGIIRASDLAGYRNQSVFIRRSKHVPPSQEQVRDLMSAYFDLLSSEKSAGVRAVLGHFAFVYIHPYVDGNGRIARFLMNLLMASGGYPWTIVPVMRREEYMSALESASADQNIRSFAEFLASLVEN
ncbi:MAG: Fic family protein [Algoriphagus aquaeductus]|uniref:Fic family protein n=1 Tax=Algoriphagus aquaeductus TaxID=475299 RepID=UPI00391BC402